VNGKKSEAQALMALLSLEEFEQNRDRNRGRYQVYRQELGAIPGVTLVELDDGNNFQYVVIDVDPAEFGLDRDDLMNLLMAENVVCRRHFYPGVQRKNPYFRECVAAGLTFPNSERLGGRLLQLPNGNGVSHDHARRIVELIATMGRLSGEIKRKGVPA